MCKIKNGDTFAKGRSVLRSQVRRSPLKFVFHFTHPFPILPTTANAYSVLLCALHGARPGVGGFGAARAPRGVAPGRPAPPAAAGAPPPCRAQPPSPCCPTAPRPAPGREGLWGMGRMVALCTVEARQRPPVARGILSLWSVWYRPSPSV